MPHTIVPFGEWLPDQPDLQNPGATVATNVVPDFRAYRPFPSSTVFSNSLGGRCQGASIARDTAGNYYNYAGDASALYKLVAASFSNVSRLVGGAYTVAVDDFWEFTQFGNLVIAVDGLGDEPQATTAGAANFAALSGSPPRARHIATVRDFVVLGNISGSPQMVRWSAINNATSWTADPATLADFQELPGDGGWVQRIVGGEYGVIFQERSIYRMTFVGSPLVFQFDKVQTNTGAYCPQSVVSFQNLHFFLSESGFAVFDGTNVEHIGDGKVDHTFFDELDTSFIYRIQAAIDPVRHIVAWAYPAAGNSAGNPNRILIYHWPSKRWSRVEVDTEYIFRSVTGAITLDGLDSLFSSLDAVVPSLDSQQWANGNLLLGSFNTSHRLSLFNGSAMAATVETPEIQFNSGADGLSYITELRPLGKGLGASWQACLASRLSLTESVSYSTALSPISGGFVQVRSSNRYHRFCVTTTTATEFTQLQGIMVNPKPAGER